MLRFHRQPLEPRRCVRESQSLLLRTWKYVGKVVVRNVAADSPVRSCMGIRIIDKSADHLAFAQATNLMVNQLQNTDSMPRQSPAGFPSGSSCPPPSLTSTNLYCLQTVSTPRLS